MIAVSGKWVAGARVVGTLAVAGVLAAACSSSKNNAAGGSSSSSQAGGGGMTAIETHSGALGTYLTDSAGHAVYLFEADKNGKSACYGQCASYWPPVIANGSPEAMSGVQAGKLGTTTRTDGTKQVTYNGHPLYTYINDKTAGDTTGEGSTNFGAEWYLLSPSGSAIEKSSGSSSSTTSGGGGGGYGGY